MHLPNVTRCGNNSANSSQLRPETSPSSGGVVNGIVVSLLILLTFSTNALICTVFRKRPHLLSVSHSFVLNLACIGLGFCFAVLPFNLAAAVTERWVFGFAWCQVQAFLVTLLFACTTITTTFVSVDRYYAILSPLKYPYVFTPTRGIFLVCVTWIMALFMALPPVCGWGEYAFQKHKLSCALVWSPDTRAGGYLWFFSVITFFIPVLTMAWCYINIFVTAIGHWKRSNRIYPQPATPNVTSDDNDHLTVIVIENKRKSNDCKAARTILLIGTSFLVCWVPYCIVSIREAQDLKVPGGIQTMAMVLAYFSAVANPCIYGFLNKIMRYEMFRVLRGAFICPAEIVIEMDDVISTTNATATSRISSSGRARAVALKVMSHLPANHNNLHVLQTIAEMSEEIGRSSIHLQRCNETEQNERNHGNNDSSAQHTKNTTDNNIPDQVFSNTSASTSSTKVQFSGEKYLDFTSTIYNNPKYSEDQTAERTEKSDRRKSESSLGHDVTKLLTDVHPSTLYLHRNRSM